MARLNRTALIKRIKLQGGSKALSGNTLSTFRGKVDALLKLESDSNPNIRSLAGLKTYFKEIDFGLRTKKLEETGVPQVAQMVKSALEVLDGMIAEAYKKTYVEDHYKDVFLDNKGNFRKEYSFFADPKVMMGLFSYSAGTGTILSELRDLHKATTAENLGRLSDKYGEALRRVTQDDNRYGTKPPNSYQDAYFRTVRKLLIQSYKELIKLADRKKSALQKKN
ncbi:MAG: hypothetical protein ABH854_02550 [Candidatus Diapherotrites archaeon]|nr:hypothetical protein [Candidatus Micrarchaeota archaeon]MBU1939962.1 hypothetical protein [Candidatus Micrarchaeota archaeon]